MRERADSYQLRDTVYCVCHAPLLRVAKSGKTHVIDSPGHNRSRCILWLKHDPSAGYGQPDIHDVPMRITDGSVGCYIDRGHDARARLSAWRERSRPAYDYWLTHREGSSVIDLDHFMHTGHAVRKT